MRRSRPAQPGLFDRPTTRKGKAKPKPARKGDKVTVKSYTRAYPGEGKRR